MMNTTNFEFVCKPGYQIIEIKQDAAIYDLHNAAEFLGFSYNVLHARLVLDWHYYFEDFKSDFKITIDGIENFEVTPRDKDMPFSEDDCLEEIINSDGWLFKFMGGMQIRVVGERAALTIYNPPISQ